MMFSSPQHKQILWTAMHYGSRHGHTEFVLMLGTGVKCNKLLTIYYIFFSFFNLWKLAPTLAPAAYSHGSVTKQ